MLAELFLAGGIAYSVAKATHTKQKSRKTLASELLAESPDWNQTTTTREDQNIVARAVSFLEQRANLSTLKKILLDPLLGDARLQHRQSLTNTPHIVQISPEEQAARQNLTIATAGLALAMAGTFAYWLFYLPSIACTLSIFRTLWERAYKAIVEEHRINSSVVDLLMVAGPLLFGFFLEITIATWFFVFVHLLVAKTEDHSKNTLVNLFGEQPRTVWILVDDAEIKVPFEQVQLGDIIIVDAGQTIPVDGTIIDGVASIDQRMLTGEAQPSERGTGELVYMATVVLSGRIKICVEKTGWDTVAAQVGKILDQTIDFKNTLRSRSQVFVDRMAIPVLMVSALAWPLSGISGAFGIMIAYPGYRMLMLGPLSMLSFLQVASQRGILIKDGRSLELLHTVDTVVFDKTGTLTLEEPHVSHIHCCSRIIESELLLYAAAAEAKQTHPIARAILTEAEQRQLCVPRIEDAHYQLGYGIKVRLNAQTIHVGSDRFMKLEGITIPLTIQKLQADCHAQGYSLVTVALDNEVVGAIELQPTIRPEAKQIVHSLQQRGLDTIIISGDHDGPTRHLADELGISRYFAQVLPEDKANLVANLELEGRSVCFVGDGINDVIALKKATASISLRGATSAATDTAQVVLMDASLNQLEKLFEMAEEFEKNMKINFISSVAPSVLLVGGTFIFGWGLLTSILIQQTTTIVAMYNSIRPLLQNNAENSLDPSQRGTSE